MVPWVWASERGEHSKGFALTWYRAFNLVLFASTTVCCAGRPATRYRAAREPLPRVPTAFQGSKCVRGELKRRKYHVKARYQIRANALIPCNRSWYPGSGTPKGMIGLYNTIFRFTSSRLCTSQSSFHSSGAPALPTPLQYYCTAIGQYTPPLDLPLVYYTPYGLTLTLTPNPSPACSASSRRLGRRSPAPLPKDAIPGGALC